SETPPPVITEGGLFKSGFNSELDELIDLVEHGEQRLRALLGREQEAHSLPKLKLGHNRVFGYYFELPKALADSAPPHFNRRQTVANAERYITPDLKDLEDNILAAGDKRNQLEFRLFQELRVRIDKEKTRILFMADALAGLDFWQSLAETAKKRGWVRPVLTDDASVSITQGRHPVVEATAPPSGFVPNDLRMDRSRRLLIITGPNMAGKSTVLRQTAILTILAQMGSFVPASEAVLGIADRVFSRVGASDNLAQGQSTFMVEMMETARILRQATAKSLVILDEIGRGTSTFDGLSLAWAVAEDLSRRGEGAIRTLFATHYHELTALEGSLDGVRNMNIGVIERGGDIHFTRRLLPGPADRSYGIEVARLAGVPMPVVQRAKQIMTMLEAMRGRGEALRPEAMQGMLPGIAPKKAARQPESLPLPPRPEDRAHPLFTILAELDTDNLTPLKALALITEWKSFYGDNTP
ncbi:MAG: DNA mismatch repair protein MutS, partial [Desulfovibrio sp.]|nr:DNA mismatch repair protein MutS [Desulfovibrio sp.]